jgi:hypothetical protein
MASPQYQIEFLSNLQRLLSEGSFVSTYKYALLLALADLSVELGRDDDLPLQIPTRRIGEKFAEYYWRQCAPYLPAGGEPCSLLRDCLCLFAPQLRPGQEVSDGIGTHSDAVGDDTRFVNQVGDGCGKHGVTAGDFPLLLQHHWES